MQGLWIECKENNDHQWMPFCISTIWHIFQCFNLKKKKRKFYSSKKFSILLSVCFACLWCILCVNIKRLQTACIIKYKWIRSRLTQTLVSAVITDNRSILSHICSFTSINYWSVFCIFNALFSLLFYNIRSIRIFIVCHSLYSMCVFCLKKRI
jgi:hypothetical protein